MADDALEPSPAPEPASTDAGDRKLVPLVRPWPNPPSAPADENDDPGPRAA